MAVSIFKRLLLNPKRLDFCEAYDIMMWPNGCFNW